MWNIRPSLKKSEFCLRVLLHGQERSFSVPRMHLPNLSIAPSLSTLLWAASLLASSYFKLLRLVVCLFQLPLALPKRYLMAPTKWQQMKMTVCSPPSFPVRPQRVLWGAGSILSWEGLSFAQLLGSCVGCSASPAHVSASQKMRSWRLLARSSDKMM